MTVLRRLVAAAVVLALAVVALALAFDRFVPYTVAHLLFAADRRQSGLQAKRVRVDGLDVAYLEGGAGATLVLVHGFGGDKDNFTRVARWLTPHYRVLIPDLPGFGDSARPEHVSYAIDAQAERLRAFVRAAGETRVHLGGNSMGGFIVTQYAVDHPDEVVSLWLLAPAGTAKAFDSDLTRQTERGGDNPLLVRRPDDFPRTMGFVMAEKPFMPYSIRHVLSELAAADYPLHARIFDEIGPGRAALLDDALPRLAMPTLVVWGTRDRALNPAAADVYRSAMPHAEVSLVEGVGHLPMLEAPEATARAYLVFRDRIAAHDR